MIFICGQQIVHMFVTPSKFSQSFINSHIRNVEAFAVGGVGSADCFQKLG